MRNFEVTFIVDPVLSGDEIKATAKSYVELLEKNGCKIVHVDEMGLRQLAYPINRRTSGIYYTIEFEIANGDYIKAMELTMKRDERVMRFLTVRLDKYGVKYNDDKRNGLIGKVKKVVKKEKDSNDRNRRGNDRRNNRSSSRSTPRPTPKPTPKPAPVKAATPAPAPVATPTVVAEEEE